LVLDLSAVYGTAALPAVMVCAGAWLSTALTPDNPAHGTAIGTADEAGGVTSGTVRQRLLLVDEAWALLHLPATTAWLQGLSKLARSHGLQLITVVHRASDLAGQADNGSAAQAQARGLLSDAETRVLYAQTAGERALLADLLDLTGPELELLTRLPPYRALWRIGQHRAVVDHVLSRREQQQLIDTDRRMRSTHNSARDNASKAVEVDGHGAPLVTAPPAPTSRSLMVRS
jgi:hypothetical protein